MHICVGELLLFFFCSCLLFYVCFCVWSSEYMHSGNWAAFKVNCSLTFALNVCFSREQKKICSEQHTTYLGKETFFQKKVKSIIYATTHQVIWKVLIAEKLQQFQFATISRGNYLAQTQLRQQPQPSAVATTFYQLQ